MLLVVGGDTSLVQGYDEQPGWAHVPHRRTPASVSAPVLMHDGHVVSRVLLHALAVAHPYVQVLPGDELLIVGARCRRVADGTAEHNAHIYGFDGVLRRTTTFGDGSADVQTTTRGDIWVSYFDEGVCGTYGWGYAEASTPIGAPGLVRFDRQGSVLWSYHPPLGVGTIDD